MEKYQDSSCLRVAVNNGVSDVLANHPEGLHVQEIAKKINVDATSLARILRRLCISHIFEEGKS